MGGFGSGCRPCKVTVESNLVLRLSELLQADKLKEGSHHISFWRFGKCEMSLNFRIWPLGGIYQFYFPTLNQYLYTTSTPLHFGGVRWWLICPKCQKRYANLSYSASRKGFYCRKCLNLTYASSQNNHNSFYELVVARMKAKGEPTDARQVEKDWKAHLRSKTTKKWKRKRDREPFDLDKIARSLGYVTG